MPIRGLNAQVGRELASYSFVSGFCGRASRHAVPGAKAFCPDGQERGVWFVDGQKGCTFEQAG